MGTDAAIFRTLGKQTAMRTDQYNSRWLNGELHPRGLSGGVAGTRKDIHRSMPWGEFPDRLASLGRGWLPVGDSVGEEETEPGSMLLTPARLSTRRPFIHSR